MTGRRLLLRGGLVGDGIGRTTRPGDVLTDGDLIVSTDARGAAPAGCEVPGSVVCPGFIDAHVHAEGPLLAAGRVDGALAQGVTTLVAGQDGQSWIGASAATARYLNRYFGPVNGVLEPARALSVAKHPMTDRSALRNGQAAFANILIGPHTRWATSRQKHPECSCQDPLYANHYQTTWHKQRA